RGRKWKHVIEPRLVYNYVTGVNNFSSILRFDERDILSDTNEVGYSVVNRLYSKRTSEEPDDCSPPGMPTLVVGGAPAQNRIPWQRYEPTKETTCRAQTSNRTDIEWDVDYDFKSGHINNSTALLNYRIGAFTLGGGNAFLRVL